jgi:LuxR family maltose regulon positive regulatory protein
VLAGLAALYHRQGRLELAANTYHRAAQAVPDPVGLASLPHGASYYFGLGALYYEWNNLEQAEALFEQGQAAVRAMSTAEAAAIVRGYDVLARFHQARGDSKTAWTILDELGEVARQRRFVPAIDAQIAAVRARLALAQGDIVPARRWATTSGLHDHDAPDFARELQYLTFAHVQIATGQHEREHTAIDSALTLLERLLAAATSQGRIDSAIEILILQALAYQAQRRTTDAVKVLDRALQLAKPEGYIRRFVDAGGAMAALLREANVRGIQRQSIASLLAAFPADHLQPSLINTTTHTLPQGETLTEREREVLRLLADGQSNQAIADALVLAVGTVKRHMNNIFAKLDVQSRLQAVARARELDLL